MSAEESNATTTRSLESSGSYGELNLPYVVSEIVVAVTAVIGNGLVILVFKKERKLRRRTNYYIISLATADLLVGLFAIPFAILASIGLPTNLYACLFTVSVLVVLCTISIFCLVAVSIDRYWAILHPMGYSRTVRTKTAIGIICVCWVLGTLVGFLPLLGWNAGHKSDEKCIFTEVMDYNYLVFLYCTTIIFPAILIIAFYAHIWSVVVKQLQQIMTMNPGKRKENEGHGTMLRLLGAAQKRDVKASQNLSRIVAFFIICWFPLYTINCVMAFCHECQVNNVVLNTCIILSHLNSAGNPLLYAYHLKDFRAALKNFIYGLLFPGRAKSAATATAATAGPVSVIQEQKAGAMIGSQRGGSSRSLATAAMARSTAASSSLRYAQISEFSAAASGTRPASTTSLMRQVHEARLREMQIAAPPSFVKNLPEKNSENPQKSDANHNVDHEKLKKQTSSILRCNGHQSGSNDDPAKTKLNNAPEGPIVEMTTKTNSVEMQSYTFKMSMRYADCDNDEDYDDDDDEEDEEKTVLHTESTLTIEADVNRETNCESRLLDGEIKVLNDQ
ncbi:unnamed protein product [Trichogramma brassicae]|uniref:G-protein coupled receptors family 1 profile domain-containing protein n=1 Tax=Trichogramma brassicae TaxID=86971 RepID=A0A6H5IE74_9HYME|nr:unnamed protein product [Trichogramma brassicae]